MEVRTPPTGSLRPRPNREGQPNEFIDGGGFLAAAQNRPWFVAIAVLLPSMVAGFGLAPGVNSSGFAAGEDLLGTPASVDIKAPRDISIEDPQETARLAEEARSQVAKVYDLDAGVLKEQVLKLERAWEVGQDARAQAARQGRRALASISDETVQALGLPLKKIHWEALWDAGFPQPILSVLRDSLTQVLSRPVLASRDLLKDSQGKGITVQRVPDDGSEPKKYRVQEVSDIADAKRALRNELTQRLDESSPSVQAAAIELGTSLVQLNLTENRAATEIARSEAALSIKRAKFHVQKGEMVIRDGDRYSQRHLTILRAFNSTAGKGVQWLTLVGATLVVALLAVVLLGIARWYGLSVLINGRDLLLLGGLFMLTVLGARMWVTICYPLSEALGVPVSVFLFGMPVATTPFIVRLVLRAEMALIFSVLLAVVVGLVVDADQYFGVYAIAGAVLGGTLLRTMTARIDILRAAIWVAVGQSAAAVAIQLFTSVGSYSSYAFAIVAASASAFGAAFLAVAGTSVVEWIFSYTTDLKLLELANLNHPALKELLVQAPGSYHHSIIVGSLAEAGAEAVSANALLARVMSYYHDLGKGCNPIYFVENQRGAKNPHDKLKPSMSAMIIRRHVTDGLDIAKRYGLPQPVMAGIAEHHGTTLIHYFFQKAKSEAEENGETVSEMDFRYPGRKPQTREAAIVMLADSVEAASRSLAEPTPARLQGLVNRIINLKFTDGQLDECDITLKDLHTIARAFSVVLASIYHDRPEYPGLLQDINKGKKAHADSDPKPEEKAADENGDDPPDRPDNIKRLGLG